MSTVGCGEQANVCGPSVYGPLSRAVNEVRAWYARNPDQQKSVCDAISAVIGNIIYMATESWEVPQLHNMTGWIEEYQKRGCATPGTSCNYTVELQGRCWHSADVAYVAFGAMRKLCGFDIWSTLALAESAKTLYGPLHMLAGKYWAGKGWEGWPGGGEPPSPQVISPATYPECKHCAVRYDPALPGSVLRFDVLWGGRQVA